jgi:hypothetical protein
LSGASLEESVDARPQCGRLWAQKIFLARSLSGRCRSATGTSGGRVSGPEAPTDPTEAALRMTYYVLATRAREELHLGYDGDAEPPHLAQVPPRLLRRG